MAKIDWITIVLLAAGAFFGTILAHWVEDAYGQAYRARPPMDMPTKHEPRDPDHFYSHYCCNELDCFQAEDGAVTFTPHGYVVRGGPGIIPSDHTFPPIPPGHGKIKSIPFKHDHGKVHVCYGGLQGGSLSDIYVRCLYLPRPRY